MDRRKQQDLNKTDLIDEDSDDLSTLSKNNKQFMMKIKYSKKIFEKYSIHSEPASEEEVVRKNNDDER